MRSMHWSRVGAKALMLVHFVKRCQEAEQRRPPTMGKERGKGGRGQSLGAEPLPSPGVAVREALERWGAQKGP